MGDSTAAETWQDEEGTGSAPPPVRPHLFVVLECDRPAAGGARHSLLDVDEVIVGRGPGRAAERETVGGLRRLVVRVPGKWLSSTHARITQVDGRWIIEDAGSKNGTFVNGVALPRAELREGDMIDVGHTILSLRAALPTPPGAPLDLDRSAIDSATTSLLPSGMAKLEDLARVSSSGISVLLLGETGTGKEVLARAVHQISRRSGSLVAVNCGALPASLLEALLFGHVRGAFSGALRDEPGLVRAADRGTLFLDEIGDLPRPAQAALLRVLQEREVVPVGSVRPVPVDVRFVAATHRPLSELLETGDFRPDLFARLNGFEHIVPPLRERREDLGLLVGALWPRCLGERAGSTTLAVEVGRALVAHRWSANVRELEQALARAAALVPSGAIELVHMPRSIGGRGAPLEQAPALSALSAKDQELRALLVEELRAHQGNVSEVARSMRKARMQIQRWLKRLQLDASQFR